MRRIIGILLALVLILGVAAGCGGGGDNGEVEDGKIVLKYWTHNDEDAWNESDAAMIAAFEEENPDIKIEIESFPYDDFEQKVMTSFMSKSGGADIYKM